MTGPIMQVRELTVEFSTPSGRCRVVDRVSLDLQPGEVLGLVGESGSGKTVTCRALMRLLPPSNTPTLAGRVLLNGRDLMTLSDRQMREVRGRQVGMIFQNPTSHLDPVMAVGDQIAESIRFHDGLSRRAAIQEAVELLRRVGIPDPRRRASAYPHEFSGGMLQRVMIAAALAPKPSILIADEPTTALDVTVQAQILRLLLDLRDRSGLSVILITHDLGIVAETCDSVAVMYAGRIVERADKRALLQQPLHPYTAGLIRSQPGAGEPRRELPSIPGQPPSQLDFPSGCRFHPRCSYTEPGCVEQAPPLSEVVRDRQSACFRWRELL